MQRTPWIPVGLAFALTPALAPAQFLNRAVWLGSEEESVRRDFEQGTEYFLDRFSYVVTPPWWDRGLRRFENRAQVRLGSVTTRDFTLENALDHAVELGDDVTFRFHWLQSETRDARFQRNAVGLEYALDDRTALFAQGTPFGDKGDIDVSFGAWLLRNGDDALRVMVTLVDAPSEKSRVVEYVQAPYGLHVAGAFGDPDGHRIAFELGAQLPFEERRLATDDRFELERYIGTVETHLRVSDRDRLVLALESEYTDKALRTFDPAAPLRESFDRTFHQARAEWWIDDGPRQWSFGVLHTYHSEHGRRPNDPFNDLRTQRREWLGIARVLLPVDGKLSFEPQLFAGHVDDVFRDGTEFRDRDRFEGKIAWNARWDFSPNATLTVIVATQVDELAFGGGGAQFVARF